MTLKITGHITISIFYRAIELNELILLIWFKIFKESQLFEPSPD